MDIIDIAIAKSYAKQAGDNTSSASVDSEMSDNSTNPVQNKVVKSYIDTTTQEEINKAKSNWGVNDENQSGYIHNRPFYEETSDELLGQLTNITLSEYGKTSYGDTIYVATGNDGFFPPWYESILMKFNGSEYLFEFNEGDWTVWIGNKSLYEPWRENTWESFLITFDSYEEDGRWALYTTEPEVFEVVLYTHYSRVNEIDEKFLPYSFKRQIDWNETDTNSHSYIQNKPFGEESYENDVALWKDIAMEATGTQNSDGEDLYVGRGDSEGLNLVVGHRYILETNAWDYHDVECWDYNGVPVIGNGQYVDPAVDSPWHTFFLIVDENGQFEFYSPNGDHRTYIKIREYGTQINKIEERFLPDNIARIDQVKQMIADALGSIENNSN